MAKSDPVPALASPPASPVDDPRAVAETARLAAVVARAERRLRVLEEITEIGMRLMRKLDDAPAAGSDAPRPDPAVAFAKLSRAVRLTLDLEARVEEDLRAALAGQVEVRETRRETRDQPAGKADDPDEAARQASVSQVENQVELAIAREAESEKEYLEHLAALAERLEWDEAYDDVRDQPFREVVEALCKDIGLEPDWSDWTDNGWPGLPERGPEARPRWSPFHRASAKPILKRNQDYVRQVLELAKPPP